MTALAGPVGGVIGTPIGVPPRASVSFNEVLAICSQNVNVSTLATLDIPIPFSFGSPAELDVVLLLETQTASDSAAYIVSGAPNGLAARFSYISATDATNYRSIQLIGNVLRLITAGSANFTGRIQIIKRNRRVRAWGLLPAATTEATLPFTIKDPRKAIVSNNSTTQGAAQSSVFMNEYIPSADANSWHYTPNYSPTTRVRITSATTYITVSGSSTTTLTEFE